MTTTCEHRTLLVPPWGDNRRKWDCADCGEKVTPFPKVDAVVDAARIVEVEMFARLQAAVDDLA